MEKIRKERQQKEKIDRPAKRVTKEIYIIQMLHISRRLG